MMQLSQITIRIEIKQDRINTNNSSTSASNLLLSGESDNVKLKPSLVKTVKAEASLQDAIAAENKFLRRYKHISQFQFIHYKIF